MTDERRLDRRRAPKSIAVGRTDPAPIRLGGGVGGSIEDGARGRLTAGQRLGDPLALQRVHQAGGITDQQHVLPCRRSRADERPSSTSRRADHVRRCATHSSTPMRTR